MRTATEVEIDGKLLKLTNLSKVFYPATGFAKADMIDYYTRIAPVMLPHLKKRPLTLKRYPDGAEGQFFYEKNCPVYRPKWVDTTPVWSEGRNRTIHFCMANDLPTLLWAANLAVLEFHTSLSLAKNVLRPTVLAFDLDPGPPANIIDCAKVALWLRDIFEGMGMKSFPKTSGSKGMQVYVPLNTAVTYDDTKPFAHALAQTLENEHPHEITSVMKKSLRTNKVFVDWSQNDDHKTTVCVYSLRAKDRPMVSTPVTWDEVAAAHKKRKPELLEFDYRKALDRMQKHGDLFEPVLKLKQKMPAFSTVG